jgi:NADPH2:quinone reductase
MKAAFYTENGGPDVLQYGDLPDPALGDGDVRVAVKAIGIEGGDLINRRGGPLASTRHVCGYQAAGVIEAIGTDVRQLSVGDRVIAFNWAGSHADTFVVPNHFAYRIPETLDFQEAATIAVPFGTAHDALFEYGHLQPQQTVLVQGAAGGVGLAAVQLAKAAGAIVIGTASSDERLSRIKSYGLDHGLSYRNADLVDEVRKITAGRGVDLVIDMAGGPGVTAMLQCLAHRGRYGCRRCGQWAGRGLSVRQRVEERADGLRSPVRSRDAYASCTRLDAGPDRSCGARFDTRSHRPDIRVERSGSSPSLRRERPPARTRVADPMTCRSAATHPECKCRVLAVSDRIVRQSRQRLSAHDALQVMRAGRKAKAQRHE